MLLLNVVATCCRFAADFHFVADQLYGVLCTTRSRQIESSGGWAFARSRYSNIYHGFASVHQGLAVFVHVLSSAGLDVYIETACIELNGLEYAA